MTIKNVEETIPLLDQNRGEADSNTRCYTEFDKPNTSSQKVVEDCDILNDEPPEYGFVDGLWRFKVQNLNHSQRSFSTNQKITYSWKNLNVDVSITEKKPLSICSMIKNAFTRRESQSEPKRILKNVYGIAHPGELLAIMGSSGAGKTTLLNALTFQPTSNNVNGFRYVNGYHINSRHTISRLSAYVEQDNMFLGTLTVKEHLIFQSLIRMDRTFTYRQKLMRVEHLIKELGLEKCQNTMIGHPTKTASISGGEMKRLSFASEILTNPPLMFCDEPTSGLDSIIALNVITVLKSLSISGKTVICTIHQPSSDILALFDKILLLAEGRTAFLGKPSEAISFFTQLGSSPFSHYNPADFYIQLLAVVPNKEESCRETIKFVCDSFDDSPYGLKLSTIIECGAHSQENENVNNRLDHVLAFYGHTEEFKYSATWLLQFRALFWRSWITAIKEPLIVKVRLFQTVVLSLVVGLIYHQQKLNEDGVMNINGVLFTFLTNMTFQNLFAVISVFCSELPIFLKEHSNKMYRVDVYFLSKTLAEIPMFLAIPIIFTTITYFWINLNPKLDHFLIAMSILILVTNVATSFGYFISCISTNVVMALSIGPPFIIPFLLFGGFLLNAGVIPKYFQWLSYLSWFKYGNEALLINQWSDIENIECNKSNVTCPRTGEIVLEMYHFQKDNFIWDVTSLILLILLFRTLAFLALVLKTKR